MQPNGGTGLLGDPRKQLVLAMTDLRTAVYEHEAELPDMECVNFFHSKTLFHVYACTPRMKPYMVVVSTPEGRVVNHLVGVLRFRAILFPPFLYAHCTVVGEGEYSDASLDREELFGMMLYALTKKVRNRAFYIECSHLGAKMFGYRRFRLGGFFPVHWMKIHNSLHSLPPTERVSEKFARRIRRSIAKGVATTEVSGEEELRLFAKLLRKHNRLKPKRYIPDVAFFREIAKTANCKLFVTKFRKHIIGCCACVYSGREAYLWYAASLRKTYMKLHPDTLTTWHAIDWAYRHGYDHISFMDVGLPFQKNPYREFILQFGGKPVSTYRWFRFSLRWLNGLLSWIYRD